MFVSRQARVASDGMESSSLTLTGEKMPNCPRVTARRVVWSRKVTDCRRRVGVRP